MSPFLLICQNRPIARETTIETGIMEVVTEKKFSVIESINKTIILPRADRNTFFENSSFEILYALKIFAKHKIQKTINKTNPIIPVSDKN